MRGEWLQLQYQASLESLLHEIFPRHNIYPNTRKQAAVKQKKYLEVDVWLPELNLCFEFQDEYHYKPAWYNQLPLEQIQRNDDTKKYKLLYDYQTVIIIPCWWDGSAISLQSSISFQRPDLNLQHKHWQIPSNPPMNFFDESSQLMLASFPEPDTIEQGSWWIGEKWDGIRCFWDATAQQLYSRNKIVIEMNSLVDEVLRNLVLDAEIWCGRGCFNDSQSVVLNYLHVNTVDISQVRLVCFDEASVNTRDQPFESRYSLVLSHLSDDQPAALNAPRFFCNSESMLQETLHSITSEGGEGVLVRKPGSPYLSGRSASLFKMKVTTGYVDQEALVLKADVDGSLLLQSPNGDVFSVDKSDCVLPRQALEGNVVSLQGNFGQHPTQELLPSASKFVVYRIREDLSWEDVLSNRDSKAQYVTSNAPSVDNSEPSLGKAWKEIENRKVFFEKFAFFKGIDPLAPTSWYSVTPSELLKFDKGYQSVISNYGSNLYDVLSQVYPNIGLQRDRFKVVQSWQHDSARHTFDDFAASKGMDPLNPEFWYKATTSEILRHEKGYKHIASKYGGKLHTILPQLYPNIGLQQTKFKENKLKTFFDTFANSNGMDSLNPIFWYNVSRHEIRSYDTKSVFSYKFSNALITQTYPNIGLQQNRFKLLN